MNLKDKVCVACDASSVKLRGSEINKHLKEVSGWKLVNDRIVKEFTFENWDAAVEFLLKVDEIVKKEDHHPLIHLEWGKVTIELWTHKIYGLHENDFILAAKINDI